MIYQLESTDIKILKFINKNGEIHKDDVLSMFPDNKFSTLYRLNCLSEFEYDGYRPVENSSYLETQYEYEEDNIFTTSIFNGYYKITELGKSYLQNHKHKTKAEWIKEFIRSIFFPMIVALLTTIVTIWITS